MDKINSELTTFIESKAKLSQLLKDQHKAALAQIDALDFPDLSLFLQDKYVMKPKKFACDMCDRTFDTRAQMSAHKKKHTKKEDIENEVVEILVENMNLSQLKEECKKRNINTTGKKKEDLLKQLS